MRRCLVLAAGLLAGCDQKKEAATAAKPPAKIEKIPETVLATVTLTPDAERRLGIVTVPVERKNVSRTREVGGEAMPPPGAIIALASPLAGTLVAAERQVKAGERVTQGQVLLKLHLLPTERQRLDEARATAAGDIEKARAEIEAARIAFERAEKLLKENAGTAKEVDDARARLAVGKASLVAAETKRASLGFDSVLELASPLAGMVREIRAAPGQTVAAGAPLIEIMNLDHLWIRVPVYVGDVASIDAEKEARVEDRLARPVAAPPSANPAAATLDLYYQVDGGLRPGQKVRVTLPLRAQDDALVVPWAAVLHDIHGGQWVYEKSGEHAYQRRRVRVRFVDGASAVLESGPKPGAPIVTNGAAELFGTEFGIGK